jgi:formylglycine-generating enzyme required for sulfatase activity
MIMKLVLSLILLACMPPLLAQDAGTGNINSPHVSMPAGTNTLADTDTNGAPKPPGDRFTNSVDMVLVKVGDSWAGIYEVTQDQYLKVMGYNPSAFGGGDHPVDSVSWNDAMSFCQKMTDKDIKEKKLPDGFYYTLPTEGEWETLMGGASLDDAVTSQNGTRGGTAPVGSLSPNSLGLYDTRGNVMEFCSGDTDKPYRVLRGGSWADNIEINLRPEFRNYCTPDDRKNTYGFRCMLKAGSGLGSSAGGN